MAKAKKAKPSIVDKIGKWHSRVFEYVSKKAKTSRLWAILLSVFNTVISISSIRTNRTSRISMAGSLVSHQSIWRVI